MGILEYRSRIAKFFVIFVILFLLPQEETYSISDYEGMVFSDALPVQFWIEGCDTYNESDASGVHTICWFQQWLCSDEINIQFVDEQPGANSETFSLPSLSSWQTTSNNSRPDWTTGAAPVVSIVNLQTSEILYLNYNFIAGIRYTITINFTTSASVNGSANISIYDDDFNVVFNEGNIAAYNGASSTDITFIATSDCKKIGFYFSSNSIGTRTVTVNSTSAERSTDTDYSLLVIDEDGATLEELTLVSTPLPANGYVYSASFRPIDYEICGAKIKFEVWFSGTPSARMARTDYMEIKDSLPDTKLIGYSNNRNFSGLIYEDVSPVPSFTIRLSCRFFHQRTPQTDEAIALTTSIVTTSSQLKKQKLLEVKHAPYYFHDKIIEVLQHHSVVINGRYYKKEEAYEIPEGDKRWPLKTGTTYLTISNSVVRNVL